jgi:hypothetical protein
MQYLIDVDLAGERATETPRGIFKALFGRVRVS